MKRILTYVVVCISPLACSADPFKNLDFQNPNIARIVNRIDETVNVRDAIPGWQLQFGDVRETTMFYNDVCLSCASATLNGPKRPQNGDTFSFVIKSGFDYSENIAIPASVYQVGDVPISARSLRLTAGIFPSIEGLHVSLDGRELQLNQLEKAGDYFSYGTDISLWAGKNAELRFTVGPGTFGVDYGGFLADIRFSADPLPTTPEPSTWALLSTGVAVLTWTQRKRRPWGYSNVS